MNSAFSNITKSEKIKLIVCIGAVILALQIRFNVMPKYEEIKESRKQLEKLITNEEKFNSKGHDDEEIVKEVENIRIEYQKIKGKVPNEEKLEDIINELHECASKSNIIVEHIIFDESVSSEDGIVDSSEVETVEVGLEEPLSQVTTESLFKKKGVNLAIIGEKNNIHNFLAEVENGKRIKSIEEVHVNGTDEESKVEIKLSYFYK